MKFSEYIVPQGVREELVEISKNQSDASWRVARLCLGVYQDFKKRQQDDLKLQGVADYRVWRACGVYARKSGDRVKALAEVANAYPPARLDQFVEWYGDWDFGYYERTWRYEGIEQEAIFEFITLVRDGGFDKISARRLGVGEFISSYEYYVRHLQVARPPCPQPAPYIFYGGLPFGDILQAVKRLREGLQGYLVRPKVRRFVELVDQLEASLPEVMEEIGFDIEVENSVQ